MTPVEDLEKAKYLQKYSRIPVNVCNAEWKSFNVALSRDSRKKVGKYRKAKFLNLSPGR